MVCDSQPPALHWNSENCPLPEFKSVFLNWRNKANWESVPPWKQISCCGCDSSVVGTWSWPSCGGQGSWSLPQSRQVLHPMLWRSPQIWHTKPGTMRWLWSHHPARGDTVEGLIQTKEKTHKVRCEVEIPPFPLSPPHQKERPAFALLRLTVADERGVAPLLFLCFPHGEHECWPLWTGGRIAHLWLFGDSATCELRFRDYELCVSTFIVQQAPFFFVSPVSPSAILITSTVHTWLQLQAVMSQGCP